MMFASSSHKAAFVKTPTPVFSLKRSKITAALDIGSTKVCCLIMSHKGGESKVLGAGMRASRGFKGGAVVDMRAAEEDIRSAVATAERSAGVVVERAVVGFATSAVASEVITLSIDVGGREITPTDVRFALARAQESSHQQGLQILHAIPTRYTVDGGRRVISPYGLQARRLEVDVHVVTMRYDSLGNIKTCLDKCHIDIQSIAVSSYASALASLVPDERDLGALCIDMGGETTGFCLFYKGAMVACGGVPLGGYHATSDLARGLSISMHHAERLKILQGDISHSYSSENLQFGTKVHAEQKQEVLELNLHACHKGGTARANSLHQSEGNSEDTVYANTVHGNTVHTDNVHGNTVHTDNVHENAMKIPSLGMGPVSQSGGGQDDYATISPAALREILYARMEEIFDLLYQQTQQFSLTHIVKTRIVLLGGGSRLPGVLDLAEVVFGGHARLGHPLKPDGEKELYGANYAASLGLIAYENSKAPHGGAAFREKRGPLGKLFSWLFQET